MAELLELVAKPSSPFSSDLVSWLLPPQRPRRPFSKRHRVGVRNGLAFGVVWVIVMFVGAFALSGSLPNTIFVGVTVFFALIISFRTWRAESKLAAKEDRAMMKIHRERYRAFLRRRRVWNRLRYCAKCGVVVDPVTQQTRSLYEVHELANSRHRAITLR